MKKKETIKEIVLILIIIFALIMMLTSCTHYVVKNMHNEMYTYSQKQEAYEDVYTQLKAYKLDSIPPTQWTAYALRSKDNSSTEISENILRKTIDKKSCYIFIFTEYFRYENPLYPLYQFTIRYYGKENN